MTNVTCNSNPLYHSSISNPDITRNDRSIQDAITDLPLVSTCPSSQTQNLYQKTEMLVAKEVVYNVTDLIGQLMGNEEFIDDLEGLFGEEDENGNFSEVLECWIVTPKLGQELKAKGELVVEDFNNLVIWGRQTSGQPISMDRVIKDIALEIYEGF